MQETPAEALRREAALADAQQTAADSRAWKGRGRRRLRVWPSLLALSYDYTCRLSDEHKSPQNMLLLAEASMPVAQKHNIVFTRIAPQTQQLVKHPVLGSRRCAGSRAGVRHTHDQGG